MRTSFLTGLGDFWMAHFLPFQVSARVFCTFFLADRPTAKHLLVDGQEMPVSSLSGWLAGFGVAWIFQLEPFHSSASGFWLPPVCAKPTARHLVAEMQETPLSWLNVAPAGAGAG